MGHSTAAIGSSSLKNCTSLSEIKIPNSVKSIGDNCFDGCSKLDQISFNPFYTQVQFNTFSKCPSLKHFAVSTTRESKSKTSERVLIPHKATDIFNQTNFFGSSELASYINECSEITFEAQYTSPSFSNVYKKIANLKQRNSKIKIGIFIAGVDKTDQTFRGNKIIDIVRIDSSVKEIKSDSNNGSFKGYSSLTQIEIPNSVTSIGNNVFASCSKLAQIKIPNSI